MRFLRDPAGALAALHDEFGSVARARLGPLHVVQLVGPEANRWLMTSGSDRVQSGPIWSEVLPFYRSSLLATDGEPHRRSRTVMAGAFRPDRVQAYASAIADEVARHANSWRAQVDVYPAMQRLALAIAARTLFGFDLGADLERFLRWNAPMARMILTIPGHRIPLTRRWRGHRAQGRMWDLMIELIAKRRHRGLADDALSTLIGAHDAGRIDRDALLVHAFTLLAAGHETSAAFLTFAVAVVAARPDLRRRLEAECEAAARIDQVRPSSFMVSLLREVERCYPPTPYVARRALVDLAFAGFRIPRGTTLLGAMRLAHLSPQCFRDPMRFDPDRFAPPRDEHKQPFALSGFGGGPHMCLGIHFAQLEAAIVLHTLLRSYELRLVSGTDLPAATFVPFAEPRKPIVVELSPRTRANAL